MISVSYFLISFDFSGFINRNVSLVNRMSETGLVHMINRRPTRRNPSTKKYHQTERTTTMMSSLSLRIQRMITFSPVSLSWETTEHRIPPSRTSTPYKLVITLRKKTRSIQKKQTFRVQLGHNMGLLPRSVTLPPRLSPQARLLP